MHGRSRRRDEAVAETHAALSSEGAAVGSEEKKPAVSSDSALIISPPPVLLSDRKPPTAEDWFVYVDDIAGQRSILSYDDALTDVDEGSWRGYRDPFASPEGASRCVNQPFDVFPLAVTALLAARVPVGGLSVSTVIRAAEAADLAQALEAILSPANISERVGVRIASSRVGVDRLFASCVDLSKLHGLAVAPGAGRDAQALIALCHRAPNLKRLHISGKNVCSVLADHEFTAYIRTSRLESLTIQDSGVYCNNVILGILDSRIKHLDISMGCTLSWQFDHVIEKINISRVLCEIHLDNSSMEPREYESLGNALGSLASTLKTIHLGPTKISGVDRKENLIERLIKGIEQTSSDSSIDPLKFIELYLEDFGMQDVSVLAPLLELKGPVALSLLALNGNNFSLSSQPDFISFSKSMSRCRFLRQLSLRRCGKYSK
jgi:hypothetical protein